MEIRRELPDAIEELVLFDRQEMPRSPQPVAQRHVPSAPPAAAEEPRRREAPDPRQAESVMARIRALTRQRTGSVQPAETAPRAATQAREPVASEAARLEPAPRPRDESLRTAPARRVYAADGVESEVQPVSDPRLPRPADSARNTLSRGESRREPERDTVQVSFGSVVVHVEPEHVPAAAATAAQNARPSPHLSAEADNRWARSFLDRI
jgi:hypothetical protein